MIITKLKPMISPVDNNLFIGIVDTSGSIFPYWKYIQQNYNRNLPQNSQTILFNTKSELLNDAKLTSEIGSFGGGKSNLIEGLVQLEKLLEDVDLKIKVTILLITDGKDNYGSDFDDRLRLLKGNKENRQINFTVMCLGKDFNERQMIKIWELYFNGDKNVPFLHVLENVNEREIIVKFNELKKYFLFQNQIGNQKVFTFPWSEKKDLVFSNSWEILSEIHKDQNQSEPQFVLYGCYQIINNWNSFLKVQQISENSNLQKNAEKTLTQISNLLNHIKKNYDLDEKFQQKQKNSKSYFDKVYNIYFQKYLSKIFGLKKNIERYKLSSDMYELNKLEGLDEIVKKTKPVPVYSNFEINIENFVNFEEMKKDFFQIYAQKEIQTKISQNPNLKMLKEADILKAVELCLIPSELSRTFQIQGLGLEIKQNDLYEIFPWSFNIKNMLLDNKEVSTLDLVKNFGSLIVQKGESKIYVNTILPLFQHDQDQDFSEIVLSDLYQFLISINCTKKSQVLYKDSYLALLANSLLFLFNDQCYEQQRELIKKILDTVQYCESSSVNYQKLKEQFKKDPIECLINETEKNQETYKIFEASNVFLVLMNEFRGNNLAKYQIKKFLEFYIYLFVQKAESVNPQKFFGLDFFTGEKGTLLRQNIQEKVRDKFSSFKTLGDFKRTIESVYLELLKTAEADLVFDRVRLFKYYNDKLSPVAILNLYKYMLNEEMSDNQLIEIFTIAQSKTPANEYRYLNEEQKKIKKEEGLKRLKTKTLFREVFPKRRIIKNLKVYPNLLKKKIKMIENEEIGEEENIMKEFINYKLFQIEEYVELEKSLRKEFEDYFFQRHQMIIPISFNDLERILNTPHELSKKWKKKPLNLNTDNYLLSNACLSPLCKYYLFPQKKLHHHYGILENSLPKRFHITVKEYYEKSAEDILQIYLEVCKKENFKFEHEKNKQFIMNYIKKLKTKYEEILKEEE